jgi:hypothetical protein
MMQFLRSPQWVIARRLVLVGIVLIVAYRQYGDSVALWFQGANPERDITITRSELRPELSNAKPAWIIGFRNESTKFTYDDIQLEATYMDGEGKVLETDTIVVKQKLPPGDEKVIMSADIKSRGAAARGTLKVVSAREVK